MGQRHIQNNEYITFCRIVVSDFWELNDDTIHDDINLKYHSKRICYFCFENNEITAEYIRVCRTSLFLQPRISTYLGNTRYVSFYDDYKSFNRYVFLTLKLFLKLFGIRILIERRETKTTRHWFSILYIGHQIKLHFLAKQNLSTTITNSYVTKLLICLYILLRWTCHHQVNWNYLYAPCITDDWMQLKIW